MKIFRKVWAFYDKHEHFIGMIIYFLLFVFVLLKFLKVIPDTEYERRRLFMIFSGISFFLSGCVFAWRAYKGKKNR